MEVQVINSKVHSVQNRRITQVYMYIHSCRQSVRSSELTDACIFSLCKSVEIDCSLYIHVYCRVFGQMGAVDGGRRPRAVYLP